jgi:putative transposase
MIIMRAHKTELDVTEAQRSYLTQCAGASRFVYNWALDDHEKQYEAKIKTSRYDQCKRFNAIKRDIAPWITELPYAIVEASFGNLDTAFKNYFRQKKDGTVAKRIARMKENGRWNRYCAKLLGKGRKNIDPGYPKFKHRGDSIGISFRNAKIESGRVRLTGAGWIKLFEHNYLPVVEKEKYGIYTVISETAGKWFISVLVKEEILDPVNESRKRIGIDVGIKSLAVLSNGKMFENPKTLNRYERRMKRIQRELSRRVKGSRNREKSKQKLEKVHYKIACVRKHALHQISNYVVAKVKPYVVMMEDLNVTGMMKNDRLSKSIADASFSELKRQIEYKARWYGVGFELVNRWYPSSKRCSKCGNIKDELALSERTYHCDKCGLTIDRDLNAAINIAAYSEPANGGGLPGELVCNNGTTVNQELGILDEPLANFANGYIRIVG